MIRRGDLFLPWTAQGCHYKINKEWDVVTVAQEPTVNPQAVKATEVAVAAGATK